MMDLDYNLQVLAVKYAIYYLEEQIYSIDKNLENSPTYDYKLQLVSIKGLYKKHLAELKEWSEREEKK